MCRQIGKSFARRGRPNTSPSPIVTVPKMTMIGTVRAPLVLPFPRPRSRTVPDVMNDYFVVPDFIHDQILANRKSQEAGLSCRSADTGRSRYPLCYSFDTSDKAPGGLPTVRNNVGKNLIEIGKCAAFISELHALR
jgi:hypothetical protein